MKYPVSFLVSVAVLWRFSTKHPMSDAVLPLWLEAIGGALIVVVPVSLGCRLLTKKIRARKARAIDLGILFCICAVYWFVDLLMNGVPSGIHSPLMFWLRLTVTSWTTLFLPFGATVAVFEWIGIRSGSQSNAANKPIPALNSDAMPPSPPVKHLDR